MDHYLRSVATMIEVTSHHMECTHFNLDYSQMPAVAQHQYLKSQRTKQALLKISKIYTLSHKQPTFTSTYHKIAIISEPAECQIYHWSRMTTTR